MPFWTGVQPAVVDDPDGLVPGGVVGLPALNAIRSVVAAPPGLLTSADLPLRGFAGRFA
jgi:4-hydroxy-tetrahydrodipicolinate reductase